MRFISIATLCFVLQAAPAFAQKFRHDDPIAADNDAAIHVKEPARRRLSDYYDFIEHTFGNPGDRSAIRALNVNTLGEVPDSSWFTNRTERNVANMGTGPSTEAPWQVVEGKSEGITPGFRIRDSKGELYVLKFDPMSNPEMATAAEIISTQFFHAIGYNVPENTLITFTRDQLVVGPNAKIKDDLGKERAMNMKDLDRILTRVPRGANGRYRAVASKFLSGKPIGPFKYYGTRSDDPNDVFPHEHRRELRGLGVFAAWLNHDDSRAINSLDMLVGKEGSRYIKHYLIDFGSTLGSGSVAAQKPRAGHEYMWEFKPAVARIASLGLWDRPWTRADYPDLPSVGLFESEVFDAKTWKPEYPNPAFMNLQPEDGYWAAKIVMSFSDDAIRQIVRMGQLSDKVAEQYVIDTLIRRRDKIGRYWLSQVLSLDNFRIVDGTLRFEHLLSEFDFGAPVSPIQATWYRFDNHTGQTSAITSGETHADFAVRLPEEALHGDDRGERLFLLQIAGRVSVYIRIRQGNLGIVGIERN
jgi:hypothetical protein